MRSRRASLVAAGALAVVGAWAAAGCHARAPAPASAATPPVAAPAAPTEPRSDPAPDVRRAEPVAPPRARRRVVTSTTMVILEPIRFVPGTAQLDPRSHATIDALADTFAAHTDLEIIEVRAYGVDAPPALRRQLGQARAHRVIDALVARGVAPSRLVPLGVAAPPSPPAPGEPVPAPEFRIVRRR